jgi:cytochrome c551/c552
VRLAIHGQEPPNVGSSYANVAAVYRDQGNQLQAKEMANKAYNINLNVLGPDHPRTKQIESFYRL